MYNIEDALGIEKSTSNFIEAGIQENVKLTGVRVDTSVNGNDFIEFSFKKANSGTATHTEWKPNKSANDTDEIFNERCKKQYARMLQILLCFYTKEQLKEVAQPKFTGFKDLAEWVQKMLEKANIETTPLRVKFIYNDNDFISLPRYAKYTFIEPMTITAENSQIRVLGIDKVKRSVKADVEEIIDFDSSKSTANESLTNDLPF